ncbi:phenylacetate-CoA oxygenase subunit PaaI [Paraflavitalea soli]|uniref:Phenylacetate-CoA oxygenase subunit PaaI n=1 Tax=Paraflavitalea soli TaxID=2315862 RepID=A0A3B7MSQ7_9BACT|nr:1,2-phenylacetyl-CoA epoxidase subunit PaaC [Paraflavitalea soli]AXY76897.1 phenylacetate-CoA oxygenase subunit PaaI [Paraflavitalea soli]
MQQPVNFSTDQLVNYILNLADNTLILSQRNSEWCGHGPVLEQDIAITNISLDLIGQARSLYQYAASLQGGGTTEDALAYLRGEREFKNCLITELPNGDWGQTILRQLFFSVFQQLLYAQLLQSKDATLAAIAEKSLKEVTYHVRWSSEWVIRLGDGTEESHQRMEKALETLWSYTGEFFIPADYETAAVAESIGVDVTALQQPWLEKVQEVLQEATLPVKEDAKAWMHTGGKSGRHTEHLGFILAEMQYMQRAYPGAEW